MTRTKTRALANWPNNAVSVLDYGAVGDGVTDDTSAIQAAIAYLNSAENLSIIFPSGTYMVSKLNTITSNGSKLTGDSATIKSTANALEDSENLITIEADNVELSDLNFDGNQYAYSQQKLSRVLSVTGNNATLRNLSISNSQGIGINLKITYSSVNNISVCNNAGLGMSLVESSYTSFYGCHFDANGYGFKKTRLNPADDSHDFQGFGVAVRFRSHEIHFTNCSANNNGRDGFNVNQGTYSCTFTACQCNNNDDGGFTIAADSTAPNLPGDGEGCSDIEYIGCTAVNNFTSGLVCYQSGFNIKVTGGQFYNNNRVAGSVESASSFISGIYFANSSQEIVVDGASCFDDRQIVEITGVSGGTLTAPGWVSGTKDFYPKVSILDGSDMSFKGYGKIISEATGTVTIQATSFNSVTLGDINAGDYVTQAIQHIGVFMDNNVTSDVNAICFGETKGVQVFSGQKVFAGAYDFGQNMKVENTQGRTPELIANPDLDSDVTDWTVSRPDGGSFNLLTSGLVKSPGSLELIAGTSLASAQPGLVPSYLNYLTDTFVTASVWVHCNTYRTTRLIVFWVLPGGTKSSYVEHPGGGWKLLSVNIYLPAFATDVIWRVTVDPGTTAVIDNCSLTGSTLPILKSDTEKTTNNLPRTIAYTSI